jgi:exosortase A-associated hydrolase 2
VNKSKINRYPFFLSTVRGDLFCLYIHPVNTNPRGGILFFPPFAEEMNKARHLMLLQARQLALLGYGVLVLDLYGTGDSQGELGDATWEEWCEDMFQGYNWLLGKNINNISFLSIRLGCLLALDVIHRKRIQIEKLIFWQPITNGNLFINQFLRLRMAADLLSSDEKISTKQLSESLLAGDTQEIAGYHLTSSLYKSIRELHLDGFIDTNEVPISWFEILADENRQINKATQKIIENKNWTYRPIIKKIIGEQFWATPEIAYLENLLTETSALFE